VHLLGGKLFVVYTDHASLRTATKSPHLSQRMVRWLAYFAEYNFVVEYKPGKTNVLADALSRRPDWDPGGSQQPTWDPGGSQQWQRDRDGSRPILEVAVSQCRSDIDDYVELNRVAVSVVRSPLAAAIQEKYASDPQCAETIAFLSGASKDLSQSMRAKIARFSYADGLLWHRIADADYARVVVSVTGRQCAALFLTHVFRLHGMPSSIVSDRDPRFTGAFWREFFRLLGTSLCDVHHGSSPV